MLCSGLPEFVGLDWSIDFIDFADDEVREWAGGVGGGSGPAGRYLDRRSWVLREGRAGLELREPVDDAVPGRGKVLCLLKIR